MPIPSTMASRALTLSPISLLLACKVMLPGPSPWPGSMATRMMLLLERAKRLATRTALSRLIVSTTVRVS